MLEVQVLKKHITVYEGKISKSEKVFKKRCEEH